MFPRLGRILTLLVFGLMAAKSNAHSAGEEIAEATSRFLAALSSEQKAKCLFAVSDAERKDWHFVPQPRKGLPLKELTPSQRHLAHGLLASGLSHRGYLKATSIMSLEAVLKELEQGRGPVRDPELFYITVFGTPGASEVWGWRVEGHHLSLNFAIAREGGISVTPSFFGSNPAEVRAGPRKGLRILAAEEDLARKLVQMLDSDQQRVAIYSDKAPSDILTGADRKARLLEPIGLTADKMTSEQTDVLWELIKEYVYRHRSEIADLDLKKIQEAGLPKLSFAWAGPMDRGQPHYYRVQGPTFLLEYDNTQNQANHVHTVWRDLEGDFGEDLLRKHYKDDHR